MTTLIWCLFIAGLLPLVAKAPVVFAMNKLGGYDNNHPREQQSKLTGFGARALAAHQNAFESFIIFAPAVLLAIATHHIGANITLLAIDKLRSVVWFISTVSSFSIIVLCIP